VGLLESLAARSQGSPNARDDRPGARRPQQPAVQSRGDDLAPASPAEPRGRSGRVAAVRHGSGSAAEGPPRGIIRSCDRLLLRRPVAYRRTGDGSSLARRGCAAVLRARDPRARQGYGGYARARFPQTRWFRHHQHRLRTAVGRAERVATARLAHDPGGASLRACRPRQHRARALARDQPPHLSPDRQDDGEIRRRRSEPRRGWGRVPQSGRLRMD
jgi:hypothetical protein